VLAIVDAFGSRGDDEDEEIAPAQV
jgi:hypothetical protein